MTPEFLNRDPVNKMDINYIVVLYKGHRIICVYFFDVGDLKG